MALKIDLHQVRSGLETITPEKAKEYLARSVGNRKISHSRVQAYVNEIRSGHWRPYAGCIQFDEGGRLVNGHHRLHAFVSAGLSVSQYVQHGIPSNTIDAIDVMRGRSVSDIIDMDASNVGLPWGSKNSRIAAALAMGVYFCVNVNKVANSPTLTRRIVDAVGAPLFEDAIGWVQVASASKLVRPAFVAASLLTIQRTLDGDHTEFCERVVKSIGEDREPARELSRWLLRQLKATPESKLWGNIAGPFQAHLESRQLAVVRENPTFATRIRQQARATWARSFATGTQDE